MNYWPGCILGVTCPPYWSLCERNSRESKELVIIPPLHADLGDNVPDGIDAEFGSRLQEFLQKASKNGSVGVRRTSVPHKPLQAAA